MISDIYHRRGFTGIGGIGDTGDEWVFFPAPEQQGDDLPMGESPLFFNKRNGAIRICEFGNSRDDDLLDNAVLIAIPSMF